MITIHDHMYMIIATIILISDMFYCIRLSKAGKRLTRVHNCDDAIHADNAPKIELRTPLGQNWKEPTLNSSMER